MGDDCCNPESMGRVKGLLESQLPGTFIYSVRVGDTTESDHKAGFFGKINDQVDAVCEELSSIPELMNGFNAIGFSQVKSKITHNKRRMTSVNTHTKKKKGGLLLRYEKCMYKNSSRKKKNPLEKKSKIWLNYY